MNTKLKDYKNEILRFLKEASEELENNGEPTKQEVTPEEMEPTENGEVVVPQKVTAKSQRAPQPEITTPEVPQQPQEKTSAEPQVGDKAPNTNFQDEADVLAVWTKFKGTYDKLKNAMENAKIGSIKDILENANKEPEGGQ